MSHSHKPPQSPAIASVAEKQMRTWALDLETRKRVAEEQKRLSVPQLIRPYVALSRECGTNAGELANDISARCGWNVLDRQIIDHLAEYGHLSRTVLESVDERTVSWFHEIFGKWLDSQLISQAEYLQRLGRLVLLAAQHESQIFVGRGVQFMLPREFGLAVRLIAPLKHRVACIQERKHCTARDAKSFIATVDEERAKFVRRYFHHDVAHPALYDFVINLQCIPRDEVAKVVASEAMFLSERIARASSPDGSASRQFQKLERHLS